MDKASTRRTFLSGAATALSAVRAAGANDRIRIGLIGGGGRGGDHIRELTRLKDYNVTIGGIADVWRVNRERSAGIIAKNFGEPPKATTDYREMLAWKDIDAVIIAAPDFTHPIMLKAAVEAGKDAYVEKPFAVSFPEAKAAYLAARAGRQVVAAGTQRRSEGPFVAAAKQVQSGVLGKITRVEFMNNFHQQRWARPAESVKAEDVDWKVFQMDGRIRKGFDPKLLREWQLHPETTNGIPGLWMSHFIDLVPWFTGGKYPATAASNGGVFLWKDGRDTSDVFYSVLTYPEELAVLFGMSLTNGAGTRNMWFGTRGTLDCETWTLSGAGSTAKDKIAEPVKIQPEAVNSHMANFLECIRSRQKPRADVEAGFAHAVAVIMSADALKKGRTMKFDAARLEIE